MHCFIPLRIYVCNIPEVEKQLRMTLRIKLRKSRKVGIFFLTQNSIKIMTASHLSTQIVTGSEKVYTALCLLSSRTSDSAQTLSLANMLIPYHNTQTQSFRTSTLSVPKPKRCLREACHFFVTLSMHCPWVNEINFLSQTHKHYPHGAYQFYVTIPKC